MQEKKLDAIPVVRWWTMQCSLTTIMVVSYFCHQNFLFLFLGDGWVVRLSRACLEANVDEMRIPVRIATKEENPRIPRLRITVCDTERVKDATSFWTNVYLSA